MLTHAVAVARGGAFAAERSGVGADAVLDGLPGGVEVDAGEVASARRRGCDAEAPGMTPAGASHLLIALRCDGDRARNGVSTTLRAWDKRLEALLGARFEELVEEGGFR